MNTVRITTTMTPVRAILSGRVRRAETHSGRGHFIEVEHRRGLRSLYAHLQSMMVTVGQRVRQGQVIGAVGKTGNAKHRWITSHLHLEVTQAGEAIDPMSLGLSAVDSTRDAQQALVHADR